MNPKMGVERILKRFPDTIEACVDRYFQKSMTESLPEFAVEGWYSGFCKASWENSHR
jgi:hypothetical protein